MSYKRQRDVKSSKLNIIGDFSSEKNNSLVRYESTLEHDFIHILEYDHRVSRYYEQPIKIYTPNHPNRKYYVPDFLVEKIDGKVEIIEIKYLADLEENYSEYSEKFNVARDFCSDNNFEFKILSEDYVRGAVGWNSKFLNYYRNNKRFNLNFEDVAFVERKLKEIGSSTPYELINILVKDESRKAELLYYLWYSMSKYSIHFNIEEKLSMNSKIWK